jgi:protein-tyrosine phosphatase
MGAMRVTVVCSGNICRSPMAEVVLRRALADAGLGDKVQVDSAGTGSWHVGQPADPRALTTLARHGYYGGTHRARQFTAEWFDDAPDLVLALDRGHLAALRALTEDPDERATVRLLRSFDPELAGLGEDDRALDVPDPYYDDSFPDVLAMLEAAAPGVVEFVRAQSR